MQRVFRFYKTAAKEWYADIPEWKGDTTELQMVEGADILLDIVSGNAGECFLEMSDAAFSQAEVLTLLHVREQNLGGGGDYLLETFKTKPYHQKIWLCSVTSFVFNCLPQKIWFKVKDGISS